jgi:hypothetical protein
MGIAYLKVTPCGETKRIPAPPPLLQDEPSKNKVQGVMLIISTERSRCWVIKLAIM